jgi:hypothetical protein
MAADDFTLEIIPRDFSVELIWNDGPEALFAAFRQGGEEVVETAWGPCESHTCGVWHFVGSEPDGDQTCGRRTGIRQWHVPRFAVAEAVEQVRRGHGKKVEGGLLRKVGAGFAIGMNAEGIVHWCPSTRSGRPVPISPAMLSIIDADSSLLNTARSHVGETNSGFTYDGIRTAAGHKIRHESRRLVEAIAFERETLPEIEASNFGIYSAFCTYRDFDMPTEMPADLMLSLVGSQCLYDTGDVTAEIMDLFLDAQRRLLSQPIWGTGIDVPQSEAALILGEAMRKLPIEQRVQFVLMNGMHEAGLFLPLAVLARCINFEQYVQYTTQGFAPDSCEEQGRRREAAFIAMYGEVARV